MQISGIILHLSEDPTRATEALGALAARADLELGTEPLPGRVPAVLTAPPGASGETIRALETVNGVERVDVAFVAFDDETRTETRQE